MSIEYPIIVDKGMVHFSQRGDSKRGTSRTVFNVADFYRPYGFLIPDERSGSVVGDYIENDLKPLFDLQFTHKGVLIDCRGIVREILFTTIDGLVIELFTILPSGGSCTVGGSDKIVSQCAVMFGVTQDPVQILTHVGRVNNDNHPQIVSLSISSIVEELHVRGCTGSVYDYLDTARQRRIKRAKAIAACETPFKYTTEEILNGSLDSKD